MWVVMMSRLGGLVVSAKSVKLAKLTPRIPASAEMHGLEYLLTGKAPVLELFRRIWPCCCDVFASLRPCVLASLQISTADWRERFIRESGPLHMAPRHSYHICFDGFLGLTAAVVAVNTSRTTTSISS